jgi:hypothetical protein
MQQVNLYRDILKQEQKQSGINLVLGALAALALTCIGFSAFVLWDIHTTETDLHAAQLSFDQQQDYVNKMLAKKSTKEPNEQLIAEIEHWQNSVNETMETLQVLSGKETILSQGFSFYLKALAFKSNPEVWLTVIHIDGQNGGMRLEGSTFKPQQLPQVLQQLQNQSALKGQTFAKLMMQQSPNIDGQIDFTLSSTEQAPDANDPPQ